ncbi:4Fe-4S binding protein [Bacillus sp. T33-2]|uniref:4Fe-4S binding protein n=1 Tax=Bacillus sp. T33-2 TaxID=2054168 RepID=UPI0015E09523|nr:4Fe-4S binding protein [Bacillus sp. T33-2]
MPLWTKWLESLSYEIEISGNCLRKASPFSTCTTCIQICDQGAISIENAGLQVDQGKCNNCGRCVTVCPVQAIKGQSPHRTVENGILTLNTLPLPTQSELLYFYKSGITTITIDLSRDQEKEAQRLIEDADGLLRAIGIPPFTVVSLDNSEKPVLSRRAFFKKISFDSRRAVLETFTPASWRFNEDQFNLASMFPDVAFFGITLDQQKCILCETCFRMCPASVFSLQDNRLEIDEGKCKGCSLCTDVCRTDAITIEKTVHNSQTQTMKCTQTYAKSAALISIAGQQKSNVLSARLVKTRAIYLYFNKKGLPGATLCRPFCYIPALFISTTHQPSGSRNVIPPLAQ